MIPDVRTTPVLYLDTSVLGGYYDDKWEEDTVALWQQMEAGQWRFVSSDITTKEIEGAPENVRDLFARTFPLGTLLEVTDEMEDLAAAYIAQGVVTQKYEDDALHVAVCTVARIDFLVSWNFRHMVSAHRKAGFNGVNLLKGYPHVTIVNPLELIYENRNKNL